MQLLYIFYFLTLSTHKTIAILFNIKSISMHLLRWMYVMLGFICMDFAVLWVTGGKRKIQNENMGLQPIKKDLKHDIHLK